MANDKGFLVEFKTNPYLNKVVNCYRQEHEQCLSKQRVREVINKILDTPISEKEAKSPHIVSKAFRNLRKELNLEG